MCTFSGYVVPCDFSICLAHCIDFSLVLKNIPEIQAQPHNEKTEFPYNKDIMEKAETDDTLRGPPSLAFCNGLSNDANKDTAWMPAT